MSLITSFEYINVIDSKANQICVKMALVLVEMNDVNINTLVWCLVMFEHEANIECRSLANGMRSSVVLSKQWTHSFWISLWHVLLLPLSVTQMSTRAFGRQSNEPSQKSRLRRVVWLVEKCRSFTAATGFNTVLNSNDSKQPFLSIVERNVENWMCSLEVEVTYFSFVFSFR